MRPIGEIIKFVDTLKKANDVMDSIKLSIIDTAKTIEATDDFNNNDIIRAHRSIGGLKKTL